MLIGLTGRNAAGKGEVVKYLQTKSFYSYSLSDAIRDEIRIRGQEPTREVLIQTGNELRHRFGPAVLAERILQRLDDVKNYVIDSNRNAAEVEAFRRAKHFRLSRIEAPVEVRFQRTVRRGRENDPGTLDKFIELEERELVGHEASQNLAQVEDLSDATLVNNGPLELLYPQIDSL